MQLFKSFSQPALKYSRLRGKITLENLVLEPKSNIIHSMEQRGSRSHTVDVIRSGNGVEIYSIINRGGEFLEKSHRDYDSLEDAQNKITGELKTMYGFSKLWTGLQRAEIGLASLLILKDVILNTTNTHGGMDNDTFVILGIAGIAVLTGLVDKMNTNSVLLATHRLLAVKEAKKINLPEYQQDFLFYPEENSQQ